MNCALALRMLNAYLDAELDATTAAEMDQHLASCPACADAHARDMALRAALRASSLHHAAPPGLRKSVLRTLGRQERAESGSRSIRWWQALILGGATAVMGALGGFWLAQPSGLESLPELAVAKHVAALSPAGPRIDVASSDRHTVRPWFQGRVDFAPAVRDLSAQGFELLGARVERVGSRQAVAIVYRLHSHVIDVFTWRAAQADAPTAREATIRGFNVISWNDGDMSYVAVSDTDRGELERFTSAYSTP